MSLTPLNHKDIRTRLAQREKLPTLPTTFTKIIRITGNPRSGLSELAEVITTDPALMTGVLRAANSAAMARQEPVEDLSTAVLQLGIHTVAQIALSIGYFDIFSAKGTVEIDALKNVWLHSMTTALICTRLASLAHLSFAREAYVAGLLHDLGKLFFATSFTQHYAVLRMQVAAGNGKTRDLEKQLFGLDHQDVAVEFCKYWHLPPSLTEVACKHHDPSNAIAEFQPLIACTNIGNTWAHVALCDEPLEDPYSDIDHGLQTLIAHSSSPEFLNREKLEPVLAAEVERAKRFASSS
jgi:HD-like signal output (HDOD) protein